MSFTAAIRSVLTQYVGFTGRARRSEYWWFALFTVLVGLAAAILDSVLGTTLGSDGSTGVIGIIVNLALLLPTLAVAMRRLHDTDRSGWWLLIGLVPIVGAVVLLVFFVLDSTPGTNRFGANPKERPLPVPSIA
ncbi:MULTISPECIES: DUF805 domain-containing protein [Micromonospora]|uniref:DUF805 domain-containing protein n=1 Tax=Micromonospora sicca TaxID=2202420 RepID=A0A317DKA3_9ACTN|nr:MULTISPECIES: DUF805 domain-containing protein [unclassified Micromonospora]MBM0225596.1 DUF805 domain-containing protein [Micromonospora sp. ATA51]PWR15018.1 DUF805 domain-containing protein [Micromonospora sp. 4G51]